MVDRPIVVPNEQSERRLRVLRLVLKVSVRESAYNMQTLPALGHHDITLCSFFPAELVIDPALRLFEGDGTLRGFLSALRQALEAGEYDVLHAHSPHVGVLFLAAATVMSRARRLVRSSVYTVGNAFPNYKVRNRLMLFAVFVGFARIVCCSRSSFESCPPLLRRLAGAKLGYVTNAVDLERVDGVLARVETRSHREAFTVVVVGRLVAIKQPNVVLEAFGQVVGERDELVIVGEGPLGAALAERAQSGSFASHVCFTGLLTREAVYETLAQADVFVSASRGEGLPVAVLEAMACGCPVILSDIPPHREIVSGIDGVSLISCDDVEGFARALARIRAMSRADRGALGGRCRQHVEDHFNVSASRQQYEKVYAQVLRHG